MRQLRARAAYLLRTEGVAGVVAGACRSLRGMCRAVFTVERYVIFTCDTDVSALPPHRPGLDALEVVVLESAEDMRGLAVRGFEVPESHPALRQDWLRRGGIAFCAFVDRELAHVAWISMTPEARGCCDGLPYLVDFAHGEAIWGGSHTWPRFRNRGIYAFVCGLRLRYLHEKGIRSCRDAVRVDNISSLRGQRWWNPTPVAQGRLIRFLRWSSWTESGIEALR